MQRARASLIALIALMVTAAAGPRSAGGQERPAHAKPSSFAPRGHPGRRAYGAPIQRPILKHRSRRRSNPHPPAAR